MKKVVSKKLKIYLVVVLTVIIAITSVMLFLVLKYPEIKEEKVTILNYSNKTNVTYKVFLKPNPLYNSDSLDEDKLYLSSFVNYIKTNFQYEFNVDKLTETKGDYEVVAIVEGYTTGDDKDKTIWKKEFNLFPKTNFQSKDTSVFINKEIDFTLVEYSDFATLINETIKLNGYTRVSVVMNVNLHANSGNRVIEKKYAPSITIPLNTSYFEIAKNGVVENPEVIEETKQIQLPINKKVIIVYSIVLGLAFLALLYILIFVKGNAPVDEFKKQLNKIFKAHSSRFVAINSEVGTSFAMYYRVKSMEDLVRVADELGKPIMYRYSTEPNEIRNFYVHDDKAKYTFSISDILPTKEEEIGVVESCTINNTKEIPMK